MHGASTVTIVPFYNRRHTILRTLDSVAAQSMATERLIVIDDGSTDGGAALVRDWIKRNRDRVDCRLAAQANGGAASARNHGLRLAGSCDFVAFLDSDDLWPRDFLARTRAALGADPAAVAATSDRQVVYAEGRASECRSSAEITGAPSLWMMEHGADIASATLFRTRAIVRRGAFNPMLRTGEDAALFFPVSLDGPWLHVPGAPVTFQRGLAESLGDEGHLSRKYRDNHRAFARMYEVFFTRGGGHALCNTRRCRRLLAKAWFNAGRELVERGDSREAVYCFRKSLAWNPWRTRYCGWMVRAWLASLGREAATNKQAASQLAVGGALATG